MIKVDNSEINYSMKTIEQASLEYAEHEANDFPSGDCRADMNLCEIEDWFKDAFKAGAQFAIDELASKFEQLKQSATTLRDVVYLDGVLTVIESMKIENNN